MATISASELKESLAERLEIPKKEVDNVLWAIQDVCKEAVENGNVLMLPGVGKLFCVVRAPRMARNPRTGEKVKVPAKVAVGFKLATPLKKFAPELKSKTGRKLLEEAEEAQAKRDKARRKRERAEKGGSNKKATTVRKSKLAKTKVNKKKKVGRF